MQLEIPRCLGYGPKTLACKATTHRLKSMFFSQMTLLSNNFVLTSNLSCIYLESRFSGLWSAENIEEKKTG